MDRENAYFAVPLARDQRHLLRFRLDGKLCEFTCLPFWLAPALRVFSKLGPQTGDHNPARQMGIRMASYIDSLILAGTEEESRAHTLTVLNLLIHLGVIISWGKSVLIPTRCLEFLCILGNPSIMEVFTSRGKGAFNPQAMPGPPGRVSNVGTDRRWPR